MRKLFAYRPNATLSKKFAGPFCHRKLLPHFGVPTGWCWVTLHARFSGSAATNDEPDDENKRIALEARQNIPPQNWIGQANHEQSPP
jgi:hypothetical protein